MRSVAQFQILLLILLVPGISTAVSPEQRIEMGKAIAFNRNAGNCLSCHVIADGELPGMIGPPLVQMKLRFPDRSALRSQIWEAAKRNPDTVMPPYGRHSILTEQEVDLVVDFIHSL
ncbi:MAG: sulfur oxidation c-type cytochrome SoxX [Gammaproteobacteria bacterium]|jgi:sulfur-oxidizing protein SoxX|nr:sulfur oxidation c-type cytochrome SoxX [Gammaproteobacteria bacterium]|tara:strand:+ start:632 stop:982 length:351 start_codon:yes stop_codon:yes gene_type:complete